MNQLRLLLRQESLLSLQYDDDFAGQCLSIASSTVNTLQTYHGSHIFHPMDRFASTLYLVGALLSLACIITRRDNITATQKEAIEAFDKGLRLVTQMAADSYAARHALGRSRRIVIKVKQAIHDFEINETMSSDNNPSNPQDGMVIADDFNESLTAANFMMSPQGIADIVWQEDNGLLQDAQGLFGDIDTLRMDDLFGSSSTFA